MIKRIIFSHHFVWALVAVLGYLVNLFISLLIYFVDFFEYGSKMASKQLAINVSGFNLSKRGYEVAKNRELGKGSSSPPQ